jgi:adsorption protein B
MMLPELLALWHVALAEALLLVALLVAINGLDDLAIDVLWLMMPRRQRQPQPLPPAPPPARFAILIPAWDVSAVIGAMLQRLLATLDWPDYTVFVGLYPNDPKGQAAVAALNDPRLHVAVGATLGPTTKADCLNSLWRAGRWQRRRPAAGPSRPSCCTMPKIWCTPANLRCLPPICRNMPWCNCRCCRCPMPAAH